MNGHRNSLSVQVDEIEKPGTGRQCLALAARSGLGQSFHKGEEEDFQLDVTVTHSAFTLPNMIQLSSNAETKPAFTRSCDSGDSLKPTLTRGTPR